MNPVAVESDSSETLVLGALPAMRSR